MGVYQDRLNEFIADHNLFNSVDEDSLLNSVNRLIEYAANDLLLPAWEHPCINGKLRKESEEEIIQKVIEAIQDVIDPSLWRIYEDRIRENIAGCVNQWHEKFSEYLKAGVYYE